jgi:serine protease Do
LNSRRLTTLTLARLCVTSLLLANCAAAQTSAQTVENRKDADALHLFNSSVRRLIKRVTASVVQVMVTGYGPVDSGRGTTSLVLARQESIGSGVIIDPDGYIVTNAHVINGAYRVLVNIPAAAGDESPDQSLVARTDRTVEARVIRIRRSN